jgi:hypothetical protein
MAVTVSATDATGKFINSNVTTFDYSAALTVAAGDTDLVAFCCWNGSIAPTAATAAWDNTGTPQAMTLVGSLASVTDGGAVCTVGIFYRANPTPGQKTLHVAWTGAQFIQMTAMSFKGGGSFQNATSNTGTTGADQITVTSPTGDFAVAALSDNSNVFSSTGATGTLLAFMGNSNGLGAMYRAGVGGATLLKPGGTGTTNSFIAVGCDIAAPTVGAIDIGGESRARGPFRQYPRRTRPGRHLFDRSFAGIVVGADQTLISAFVDSDDAVLAPTATTSISLAPGVVVSDDAVLAPTATTSISLAPGVVASDDAVLVPTVTTSISLAPGVVASDDAIVGADASLPGAGIPGLSIYEPYYRIEGWFDDAAIMRAAWFDRDQADTPTIATQTLLASLYTDADAFFAPAALASYPLLPALVASDDAIYAPATASTSTLLPALYTDADAFPVPVLASVLQPQAVADNEQIYIPSASAIASILPGLVGSDDVFLAPTLVSTASVLPGIVTDADIFLVPTVTPLVVLQPGLFTDADQFYAPTETTVLVGSATYVDPDGFYAPAVTAGAVALAPTLYVDGDTIPAPVTSAVLLPTLYVDGDVFPAPTILLYSQFLNPSVVASDDAFYSPGIAAGGSLLPISVYIDTDVFPAPAVAPGAVVLAPQLFTDGDAFFAPISTSVSALLPALVSDADVIFATTVASGASAIAPILVVDPELIYAASVQPGSVTLLPSVVADTDVIAPTTIVRITVLSPVLVLDQDQIYGASLSVGPAPLLVAPPTLGRKNHVAGASRARYMVDYSEWLPDGARIIDAMVSSSSPTAIVDTVTWQPDRVYFFLNGGLAGEELIVSIRIADSIGQIKPDGMQFLVVAPGWKKAHTAGARTRYTVDFSAWLEPGTRIINATVTSSSTTATVDTLTTQLDRVHYFLTGGVVGEEPVVSMQISDSLGQVRSDGMQFTVIAP